MSFDRIAVLGAGAWGSALANVAARAGRQVTLWARDPKAAATMDKTRESPRLPGMKLADGIAVTERYRAGGARRRHSDRGAGAGSCARSRCCSKTPRRRARR